MTIFTDAQKDTLFLQKIEQLKILLKKEGAFEVDQMQSWRRFVELILLLTLSFGLAYFSLILGAMVMSLYFARCAYLAHDVAHGHWSRNKNFTHKMFHALGFMQGLSVFWWQQKHAKHHLNPNVVKEKDGEIIAIDADIDTAPFICWDSRLAPSWMLNKSLGRFWLKYQRFTAWFLFTVLRAKWSFDSFNFGGKTEKTIILAHWIIFIAALSYLFNSVILGITFIVLANLISGFILSCLFLAGHTGCEIYKDDDKKGFVLDQLRSSSNLPDNKFWRWISGGLNYQVEHHLFPLLPRSRISDASKRLNYLFREYDYDYPQRSIFKVLKDIYLSMKIASEGALVKVN